MQLKMAQYLKIEGKVQGHFLYSAGGYLYQEKIILGSGDKRLRCNKWRSQSCPSLGTLCDTSHRVFATKHSCGKHPLEVEELKLRNQLKKKVVADVSTPISKICHDIIKNFPSEVGIMSNTVV